MTAAASEPVKPRPSSSTNSGIVGDLSKHVPLSAGEANVCQHRESEKLLEAVSGLDEKLYMCTRAKIRASGRL